MHGSADLPTQHLSPSGACSAASPRNCRSLSIQRGDTIASPHAQRIGSRKPSRAGARRTVHFGSDLPSRWEKVPICTIKKTPKCTTGFSPGVFPEAARSGAPSSAKYRAFRRFFARRWRIFPDMHGPRAGGAAHALQGQKSLPECTVRAQAEGKTASRGDHGRRRAARLCARKTGRDPARPLLDLAAYAKRAFLSRGCASPS